MKLNGTSILLGLAVVVVALYVYKQWTTPTVKVVVQKEGFADSKSIVGAVVGGGVLLVFVGMLFYATASMRR